MNYYIFKIHKLNLAYIWLLQFFGIKVVYHQCELSNKSLIPKNCRQVDDYKNTDQWIECLREAHEGVKIFFENNTLVSSHLPRSVADMLAKKYEELTCFHNLCINDNGYDKNKSSISLPFYSTTSLFNSFNAINTVFTFLDHINEMRMNFKLSLKHIYIVITSFKEKSRSYNHIKNIISGASPSEIPTSANSLNACWLTDDDIISPETSSYYVSSINLTKSFSDDVAILNHVSICSALNIYTRLFILVHKIIIIPRLLLCRDIEKIFVLNNFFNLQTWTHFHKIVKFKNYITNISELWPCPSNVEVLHELGVKTIIWSYSYYGARASNKKQFQGECLNLSFASFSHIFLWDQKLVKLFRSCEIKLNDKNFVKNYFISGPVINGSTQHISYTQNKALTALGLEHLLDKVIVSAFDLPAWKSEVRRDFAIGNFTTLDVQNKFYKSLFDLITFNKNVVVLIKPKRKSDNTIIPEYFKKLAGMIDTKQVFFIDEVCSPIIIIKSSDLVITTPFTSPSMIAENCGIQNIYLDSTKNFKFISIATNQICSEIPENLISKKNPQLNYNLQSFIEEFKKIINS